MPHNNTAANDQRLVSEVFFDGLGEKKSRIYETGNQIDTDQEYDAMGRVRRVSNPYRSGETVAWTTTDYDAIGRVTTVTHPDNGTTTTTYSGENNLAMTSTTEAQRERKLKSDAFGRLREVVEDPSTGGLGYVNT